MLREVAPAELGLAPAEAGGAEAGALPAWLVHEHVEPASGYSFDIFVPSANLVVEARPPAPRPRPRAPTRTPRACEMAGEMRHAVGGWGQI